MVLDNVVKEITDTWPWNVCKTADTHTHHPRHDTIQAKFNKKS